MLAGLAAATLAVVFVVQNQSRIPDARTRYEQVLREHPFNISNQPPLAEGEEKEGDRPDLAMQQNYLSTMDPALLRPTPEVLYDLSEQTATYRDLPQDLSIGTLTTSIATGTVWTERGPKEVGGRTRALLFDAADATKKKVWAGGVSGGLWVNNDITSASSAWQKVNDFWDNLAISCIAGDPNNNQVMYVGTGEGWFNFDAVMGGGIWKTTNGGNSWTKLASTSDFYFVNDIAVRNEAGSSVVYAAVAGTSNFNGFNASAKNGLFRSADGGNTWVQVLPASVNNMRPTDIEIGADNRIYVGSDARVGGTNSILYFSDTGLAASWTERSTFAGLGFNGRIEVACAPSNANVVYHVVANDNKIGGLFRSTDKGNTWTELTKPVDADQGIPADDFSRSQAWYDLIMAVSPTNDNLVFVGAIDFFRSENGGTSWTQITKWSNNPNLNTLSCPLVHADQHQFIFRPGFANEAIVGTDGGVYYSANVTLAASSLAINARNLDYNVTQFYTGAVHPTLANYFLGGTQDNGTQKFTQAGFAGTTVATGGDGGPCFIDQLNSDFQITSFTNNNFRLSTNGGSTFSIVLIDDDDTGLFINVAEYDSYQKALFTSRDNTSIYRLRNVTTTRELDNIPIAGLGSRASALRVSPFNTSQSNLYVGTQGGRLFKIIGAQGTSPVITDITSATFPTGNISSICFGANENQILVTFSNYGVVSVWETRNGGSSWQNREGDLPNMPVRWAEYHPTNFDQVYLATELGVWSTENINVASPVWSSTNGGLANVRVDMLRLRDADKVLMAATHGRGVFTALVPLQLDQTITFSALPAKTFGDGAFDLSATASSALPVTFASSNPSVATISNSTVTIVSAGTATITATQAGNVQYKPAPPVPQTLTVNKAVQTITFNPLTQKAVNEAPFTVSASASSDLPVSFSSSNSTVAIVGGTTITITGPGNTTITATQAGNTNYLAAAAVSQTLTVVTRIIRVPAAVAMGDVFLGETKTQSIMIESIGTAPLAVGTITYPAGFTGTTKPVGDNTELTVAFAPTNVVDYVGEIVVGSNATSGANRISVTGRGIKITGDGTAATEVTVFPNPANTYLTVRAPQVSKLKAMRITDASGRTHDLETTVMAENEVRIFVGDLASGNYWIAMPASGKPALIRFTKK